MTPDLTDQQLAEIRADLLAGRKLAAVKLYKELTDCSLIEAKDFVEGLPVDGDVGGQLLKGPIDPAQIDRILDALQSGKKLNAVKIYKDSSGASLMESKAFIENLIEELGLELDNEQSGCVSTLLLFVGLISMLLLIWTVA